ncbi:MAG TPA: TrmB family transcriptional regulator [Thermoflexia bacterium]|jgi:Cd2+/Zn2+-exporting ATPase|nr:TrmB family transcriptional regulator [Thermoflexia bacterium]
MRNDLIERLMRLGFSEYEAKAYIGLLRKNPITGYELSKLTGVPRSMIYEVLGKLTARGAAMTLRQEGATKYAPVPPESLLDHLRHEHESLVTSLKEDLAAITTGSDLDYVWNIEGQENILARAREMITRATDSIYLSILPDTLSDLRPALEAAVERGVRVVIYTTGDLDLPGGRVVVTPLSEEALGQAGGLGLILVVDGAEVLIGEWISPTQARASWTRSPLFVFIAEHHLRTDLYLPQILTILGERAREVIQEEDWEVFARAMESHIDG